MGTSETLRSVIDAGRAGKRLDELTTARVIGKAAERLHAAQQLAGPGKSVGPITPTAIAIAADGTVSLDFEKRGSALAYSAPEQASGGAGDRRSDVFSLGCVMWEALTHQRLFDAMNEAAVKLAVGEREIKSPSELNANIPAELSAMCMKALSRTASDRYGSAKAMGVEIEEFLEEAGYEDSNAKVAQFVGAMKAPAPAPMKLPSLTPGAPERAAAAMAVPPTSPSNHVAPKVASAETKPVEAAKAAPSAEPLVAKLAPSVEPFVAKPATPVATLLDVKPATPVATLVDAKPAGAAAKPAGAAAKPAPPVLPQASSVLTQPASPAAIADAAATQPAAPSAIASSLPPIEAVSSFAPSATDVATQPLIPQPNLKATISAAVPPPPSILTTANATIVEHSPAVRESPITPPPETAAPERTNPEGSAPHAANPVDVVSLPKRQHRDSEQVLNKWAWQTDSHEALVEDDQDYHEPPSRKPLYYAIGAGCGVALIVVVIALASGGSSEAKKPAPTAAKETTEPAQAPAPVPPPEPAKQEPVPPQPEVAAQPPAPEPAKVDPTPAPPPPPAPEPAKTEPPAPPVVKAEPPKPEPPKPEPPKVVAKAEPPKPAPPKQPPPKQQPPRQDPPKVVAKADPFKQQPIAHDAPPKAKPDVETAYKQGVQQLARGDTQGALASLRTSLAGNPNYPPTWRGLGLVFEKLGEKDQARAAFKRYLQLAPGAGDAEQIKSRMERLGS